MQTCKHLHYSKKVRLMGAALSGCGLWEWLLVGVVYGRVALSGCGLWEWLLVGVVYGSGS